MIVIEILAVITIAVWVIVAALASAARRRVCMYAPHVFVCVDCRGSLVHHDDWCPSYGNGALRTPVDFGDKREVTGRRGAN